MHTLTVAKRNTKGSHASKKLRESGFIPAVVYGAKMSESIAISIPTLPLQKIWKAAGESSVVTLKGLGEDTEVLIQEFVTSPLTNAPIHVDFYAIEKGKKVQVAIPISFVGVAPAEKELGGTLIKVLHEVEVEALPKDLPHEIEADISLIVNFDTAIHASDLALPAGVTLITDAEEVVATVAAAKEYVEEEVTPIDIDAIDVLERGKKEEEPAADTEAK